MESQTQQGQQAASSHQQLRCITAAGTVTTLVGCREVLEAPSVDAEDGRSNSLSPPTFLVCVGQKLLCCILVCSTFCLERKLTTVFVIPCRNSVFILCGWCFDSGLLSSRKQNILQWKFMERKSSVSLPLSTVWKCGMTFCAVALVMAQLECGMREETV